VISGFITASGIIIATSQIKHILGVKAEGHNLLTLGGDLIARLPEANLPTMIIGVSATAFLFWTRKKLKPLLLARGIKPVLADILAKAGPVAAVAATTLATFGLGLQDRGVAVVGAVPSGLPGVAMPPVDLELWGALFVSALLISVVGFVESVSVAQTLAAKKRQRIVPDQELIGLGMSNIGASFTGGYPVTGGFARSVVNFDAGAETPAAGIYTAVGIALATVLLTPLLFFLPKATLAATIVVAVLSLVDLGALKRTWAFSRPDFAAQAGTILLTLGFGVEVGIITGVAVSVFLHLYRTSRPHCAVVGQVPGTEHFRNVNRHKVVTQPSIYSLRVDEALYFPNARFLEDRISDAVAADPAIRHVILMAPAVNDIDASALESLEAINHRLKDAGVTLHMSEVKGPVMDRLQRSSFLDELTGRVFLTQYDAFHALAPELAEATRTAARTAPSPAA
jgi:SulP family sulfate permease